MEYRVTEHKQVKATVRIHGKADRERVKDAAEKYLRRIWKQVSKRVE